MEGAQVTLLDVLAKLAKVPNNELRSIATGLKWASEDHQGSPARPAMINVADALNAIADWRETDQGV